MRRKRHETLRFVTMRNDLRTESRGRIFTHHGLRTGIVVTAAKATLRMDSPSTGWVTALAGLLACGSLRSCVQPSQFPSGRPDAGSPLTVAGAATDYCDLEAPKAAASVFPLSSPERPGEPARLNVPSNAETSQAAAYSLQSAGLETIHGMFFP